MTLPAAIARLNRIGINRLTRRMAGRVPPFALIEHTGRRSGTRYQTPIMVFRQNDQFVVALTYGPRTDWVKNLQRSGGGMLIYRGRSLPVLEPGLTGWGPEASRLPLFVRIPLRVMRVGDFLVLQAPR